MKKIALLIASLGFVLPVVANAATFVVTPASGSYKAGNTVTLNVSVNPTGSTIYTAMLDARFSPDVFEIVSFTLNDSMLALKQSGYDALNNSTGILTKTGGYTGGITSTTPFATIVLRAKSSGTGTFASTANSKLLDSNNVNSFAGAQNYTYTVTSPTVATSQAAVAPKTTTVVNVPKQTQKEAPATTKPLAQNTVSNPAPATTSEVAAVGNANNNSSLWLWVIELAVLLLAFGGGYYLGKRQVH